MSFEKSFASCVRASSILFALIVCQPLEALPFPVQNSNRGAAIPGSPNSSANGLLKAAPKPSSVSIADGTQPPPSPPPKKSPSLSPTEMGV